MAEHGFLLHKGEFCDAVCLRYGWNLSNIPRSCNCGTPFSIDHAMICHMGGIPTIRHNEICDMTANLLTEICHNVATEPLLQPLTAQRTLMPTLASISVLVGLWVLEHWARHIFDVRVIHPNASSNRLMTTAAAYCKHETAKKREYAQRVREVEHGFFTPLVLSATSVMACEATAFYKRLADELSRKQENNTL